MKKQANKKLSLDKLNITKLTKLNFVVGGKKPGESQREDETGCESDITVRPRNTGTTDGCTTNGQCENV